MPSTSQSPAYSFPSMSLGAPPLLLIECMGMPLPSMSLPSFPSVVSPVPSSPQGGPVSPGISLCGPLPPASLCPRGCLASPPPCLSGGWLAHPLRSMSCVTGAGQQGGGRGALDVGKPQAWAEWANRLPTGHAEGDGMASSMALGGRRLVQQGGQLGVEGGFLPHRELACHAQA